MPPVPCSMSLPLKTSQSHDRAAGTEGQRVTSPCNASAGQTCCLQTHHTARNAAAKGFSLGFGQVPGTAAKTHQDGGAQRIDLLVINNPSADRSEGSRSLVLGQPGDTTGTALALCLPCF